MSAQPALLPRLRPVLSAALLMSTSLLACVWSLLHASNLPQQLGLHDAKAIYQAACAGCHGSNGEGAPQSVAGFQRPDTFPHFNKCDETTPEYTHDWKAVIRDGGPARGFSPIMPAFSEVLTADQIDGLVIYLRSLCRESGWPLGELNVPRALMTEKAFPESEAILTTAVDTHGAPGITNELDYEKALGRRDQLEIAVPFGWAQQPGGGIYGGIGDLTAGLKHVLFSNLPDDGRPPDERTGSILSVQGEMTLATGNAAKGLGSGESSFGAFAAYDRLLPANAFWQLQAGGDWPLHSHDAARSVYLRTALGRSFNAGLGYGRLWSPMIEVIGNRDLGSGQVTDWDLLPEFQVTLSARQHVRADLGYLIPLNDTVSRSQQIMLYVLWDWFDGGLTEGW